MLGLLALLALPVTASASAKLKRVKPKVNIAAISSIGKSVQPVVLTKYAPPKHVSAKRACKGKVTAKVPLGKTTRRIHGKRRKVTKYSKQSGQVTSVLGICTATMTPKVPLKYVGKKVSYRISFDGNKSISRFQKNTPFTVKNPPSVIPGLVADKPLWVGYWYLHLASVALGNLNDTPGFFYMSPGPATYLLSMNSSTGNGIPYRCDAEGLTIANGAPASGQIFAAASLGSPFSFGSLPVPPFTVTSPDGKQTSTLQFDVVSPIKMTLQLTSSGTVVNLADGTTHPNCHTDGPVALEADAYTANVF